MNWLFRRHFWIVHLMFLAIIAIVMAKTFGVVASYWFSKTIPPKPIARPVIAASIDDQEKDYDIANERNLFAAKRESVSLDDPDEDLESDPGRWQDAGPSSLPLKLVSTMVFSDPFSSRAVIINASSGKGGVYSIGECGEYKKKHSLEIETVLPEEEWEPARPCNSIDNIATLKRIEEFRVYIFNERDRKFEYISLLGEEKRPRKIMKLEPMGEAEEGAGVRKVGATSYEIDQAELDRALSNIARLMTEARALPETDASGNVIGFKVVYMKPKSLFEKIGIEQMDVLTRINGYNLSGLNEALELFSKLKTAEKFTIDLKRGDRSITLDYSVVR